MTADEYFDYAERVCKEMIELSRKKNNDYTQGSDDPFANFKAVEMYGIKTEEGFITRMQDKMMRLGTFIQNGELQVKDESVMDTLQDLANYSILFMGYLKSKQKE